jgi:methyltransferase-like protein
VALFESVYLLTELSRTTSRKSDIIKATLLKEKKGELYATKRRQPKLLIAKMLREAGSNQR